MALMFPKGVLPVLLALGFSDWAGAQSVSTSNAAPGHDWTGYAGVGPFMYPKYTGGKGFFVIPAPLLQFEYKETYYVDLLRAGARLWSSDDKKMAFGLAAEPRFGFHSGDGPLLAGMAVRRTSLEAGPSFEWETPLVSVNLAYLADASDASKGASLHGSLYKQVVNTSQWDFGAYTGFDRIDSRISNYYFGVPASEVTANRPLYQPGAALHWQSGISGAYKFKRPYTLMFGVQNSRLGAAAANSPIVETRNAVMGYLGLGWAL
jgi:outer membrane protein